MTPAQIVLSAVGLDLILGDPRRLPHPVRLIGKSARRLRRFFENRIPSLFWAGLCTACAVYAGSFFAPWALLKGAARISAAAADVLSVYLVYSTIALGDLLEHSRAVYRALKSSNPAEARRRVGMMVGRDTENLSQAGIIRACVESTAESLVDGVTAPLFFAVFGGPAWAVLYRSINTLDSLFGYTREGDRLFGKVSALADDWANYVPARVTSFLVSFSCFFGLGNPLDSWGALIRDGRKSSSPNAGLPQAAVAGALGVRLGGENFYRGFRCVKPYLGVKTADLDTGHILKANHLVFLTSLLTCAVYLGIFHEAAAHGGGLWNTAAEWLSSALWKLRRLP